jgi:hypothetical protein
VTSNRQQEIVVSECNARGRYPVSTSTPRILSSLPAFRPRKRLVIGAGLISEEACRRDRFNLRPVFAPPQLEINFIRNHHFVEHGGHLA